MGTSVSQRSKTGGAWGASHRILASVRAPISIQIAETWRAALGDRDAALAGELCAPDVIAGARLASRLLPARAAITNYETELQSIDSGSIAVEFAKRALARTSETGAIPFGAALLSEVANYYVSRDLPSYAGAEGRVSDATQAQQLKDQVRDRAYSVAERVGAAIGSERLSTPSGWSDFIAEASRALRTLSDE